MVNIMVGSKGSGNRQPSNNARLCLTSEFLDALASFPNPKGIPKDFQIALLALKNPDFEKHVVETQGQEVYDELIKRYNRNRTEMQRDKNKRKREKLEERKKRDAMKEKDLELKERDLELQEQRLSLRNDKKNESEDEDLREELGVLNEDIKGLEGMRKYRSLKDKEKETLQTKIIRRDEIKMRLEELEGEGNGA